ncbi:hypothetical protein [Streptomyces sp. NPDC002790]|uniref:hypothetical protein n=1 Tax=Streptomyces sp. NPDC002790 TaxID=3154431 RepID=UPI00331F42F7
MSRMKTYIEDAREVEQSAGLAAQHSTARERIDAITRTFELCGTLARQYHDPRTVAGMLVHRAADSFRTARSTQWTEVAA